jgi:hypothetical protein
MEPFVKRVEKNKDVYYTVNWSKLKKTDKFDIIKTVPAFAGIYEIYHMDKYKKLNLLSASSCWHTGLRETLREKVDPLLEEDPKKKYILTSHTCYYRYSIVESYNDILDIMFFIEKRLYPNVQGLKSSERYDSIYIKEISPDKIITI